MTTKEIVTWLKIIRTGLNNFPEVSNSKKIEALSNAIDIVSACEIFFDPNVSDKECYKIFEKAWKRND